MKYIIMEKILKRKPVILIQQRRTYCSDGSPLEDSCSKGLAGHQRGRNSASNYVYVFQTLSGHSPQSISIQVLRMTDNLINDC